MKTYGDVARAGLDDWRMLARGIHARFTTGDFATGMRLVQAVGEAAEAAVTAPATMKLDLKPVAKWPSVQAASKLDRSMRVGKANPLTRSVFLCSARNRIESTG